MKARGVDELVDEARFADAGFADERDELAAPLSRVLLGEAELFELAIAPSEGTEAAQDRRLQPRPRRSGAGHLEDVDGLLDALDRHGAERRDVDESFDEAQGVSRQPNGSRCRELLHARRQVRGLPDRRVLHPEIASDGSHHDLTGVQPDTDLDLDAMRAPRARRVRSHGFLHPERGIARPHGMVLVRDRGAEERHDPVAHDLVDGAFEAMDGRHHQLEDRIEDRARIFRITIGEQLHRALQIGEEHGHPLALSLQRRPRRQDALGQMLRGVRLGGLKPRLAGRCRWDQRSAAAATKPFVALVGKATRRARGGEREAALATEAPALAVLGPASATLHGCASVSEIRGGSDRDRRGGSSGRGRHELSGRRPQGPGATGGVPRGDAAPDVTRVEAPLTQRAGHVAADVEAVRAVDGDRRVR